MPKWVYTVIGLSFAVVVLAIAYRIFSGDGGSAELGDIKVNVPPTRTELQTGLERGTSTEEISENEPDLPPKPDSLSTIPPRSNPSPQSEPLDSTQPVEFTILNELSPIQLSEEVQVYINGQIVANLMVNQQQVTDSAKVQVPKSGGYTYTLIADGIFFDQFGSPYRDQARGDGVIEVDEGSVFFLMITPHGVRMVPQ